MRKRLLVTTAAILLTAPTIANAEMITGTIASIDGALQVIRLENGAEFKLGTFNSTSEFRVGDRVRIDWQDYLKGYMHAERIWVESRKQASRTK